MKKKRKNIKERERRTRFLDTPTSERGKRENEKVCQSNRSSSFPIPVAEMPFREGEEEEEVPWTAANENKT